jgi:hypothetical protein
MSDAKVAKLEGINKALRFNSIFYAVGMFMVLYFSVFNSGMLGHSALAFWFPWIVLGLPKIIAMLFGGLGSTIMGPLKADYEVVTVDGLGRTVSSDGGFQSMQMNFFVKLIQIGAMVVIGGFITILHVIVLSIKYIATALSTKAKSSVKPNGFVIILINTAVIIGTIILVMVQDTVETAVYRSETGISRSGDYDIRKNDTNDGIIIGNYEGSKGGAIVIPATFDGLPVVCLERTFVESGNPPYGTRDNRKERITSVVIPDTVTIIDGAFYGCEALTQITLPKNLKTIKGTAFQYSGITFVVIPEGVTDIGNHAFADCANLTSVTLPQSLQRVGSSAFRKCVSLVDVKIPSGSAVRHGEYVINLNGKNGTFIRDMELHFLNEQSKSLQYETFKGCTKLNYTSRQALQDSGYTGEF